MQNKIKLFIFLAISAASMVVYSFTSLPAKSFQQPKNAKQLDSIKRNAEIADSLRELKNLKFKVYKTNAHASYYHNKFNGRRTASGKRFDNNKYTAAHRKLPFGTRLRITNEANKKSVIVEVTDRGPFTRGREIDLTHRAFKEIASGGYGGSLKVTIEEIR